MKNQIIIASALLFAIWFGVIFFWIFIPKEKSQADLKSEDLSKTALTSSHSLKPVLSNQWYSQLVFAFPTQPIYALPLSFKLTEKGLGVSFPDLKINQDAIQSPYAQDFSISTDQSIDSAKLNSVGDFHVGIKLIDKNKQFIDFEIAHGVPYTILNTNSQILNFSFPNSFSLNQNLITTPSQNVLDTFMISTRKHNYLIKFDSPKNIKISPDKISIQDPQKMVVFLLDQPQSFQKFKDFKFGRILDTTLDPVISGTALTQNFRVQTAKNGKILIALYPHQADKLTYPQTILGQYQTIRGPLKLIQTNSFSISQPLKIPEKEFPPNNNPSPELIQQLKQDTQDLIKSKTPTSQDYFLGVWFGKITTLIQLTKSYNLKDEQNKLVEFIKPIFIQSLNNFSYNPQKTSVIAKKSEFGNEKLNDHYFHYGYYIRTASILADLDPLFLNQVKDQINLMVLDIGNYDKSSDKFPYLRHFDPFEGHSWADGEANFNDGNNQESTSEAINAWYSLYLWSQVTNNKDLEKTSLYLYNSEIDTAKYYWFDIKNIYPLPYKHAIASIVWGGKIDFKTWFSDQTNLKYGIQLLPFTPASDYLKDFQNFDHYENSIKSDGGGILEDWGDLILMWKSFYNLKEAQKSADLINNFQDGNSKSLFLHYLNLQ